MISPARCPRSAGGSTRRVAWRCCCGRRSAAALRRARTARRRTLREVSRRARVSLGYLSEVERGRKEPSSELLAAICEALDSRWRCSPRPPRHGAGALAAGCDPSRPVGLRHMDLRLAGASDGPVAPSALPLPPVPRVTRFRSRRRTVALQPVGAVCARPDRRGPASHAHRRPSTSRGGRRWRTRTSWVPRSVRSGSLTSGSPRRRSRDDPRYRRRAVEAGPVRCHDGTRRTGDRAGRPGQRHAAASGVALGGRRRRWPTLS